MTSSKLKYGGYLSLRNTGIAQFLNPHTEALERPVMGAALEAINWIQKTQWRVNSRVLAVARAIREDGFEAAGLPPASDIAAPHRLSQEEYDALSKEERHAYLDGLHQLHSQNNTNRSIRRATYRLLDIAATCAPIERMWMPHFFDFRGRIYPSPQDLNPQGGSLVKGLLEFAETQPLGATGRDWLFIGCANTFGYDKLPMADRVKWTENHLDLICKIAENPLDLLPYWTGDNADSPWEALAMCFEIHDLVQHTKAGGSVESFASRQPVRMDATCSGIQHLSAMMKDELSGSLVNVIPTGKRADIYTDVAVAAGQEISLRAANGCKISMALIGRVKRKDVKQPVMTTPYGVTPRGILKQLVESDAAKVFPVVQRMKAAEIMRDIVVAALEHTIGQPRAAMQYFKDVAQHLVENGKPMIWTTPAGFTVRQAYFDTVGYTIKTVHGQVRMQREEQAAGLVRNKQVMGAAPNVVHSYDSAHLCLVAVRMKQQGIRDLSFIHDSFGAHAGNVQALQDAIRDEFALMYSGPTLEEFRQSVMDHSGLSCIPEVPRLGTMDVNLVRQSPFFFS